MESLRVIRALLLLGIAMLVTGPARAQVAPQAPENVKAAFLYHFGSYVAWPAGASPPDEFVIAVLEAPEIARELREMVAGRSVQGRPVRVREVHSTSKLEDVQILFVGVRQGRTLTQLLEPVRTRPVLIVTDATGALQRGSMINFAEVDRRIRFEISLPAARRAGLELSSRLLSVAMHVETTSDVRLPARSRGMAASRAPTRKYAG